MINQLQICYPGKCEIIPNLLDTWSKLCCYFYLIFANYLTFIEQQANQYNLLFIFLYYKNICWNVCKSPWRTSITATTSGVTLFFIKRLPHACHVPAHMPHAINLWYGENRKIIFFNLDHSTELFDWICFTLLLSSSWKFICNRSFYEFFYNIC